MPSTSISDSYAAAQKEIEDSMEGDLVSEPSLAIAAQNVIQIKTF